MLLSPHWSIDPLCQLYIGGAAFANSITGYVATPWTSPYYDIKNWKKSS
jgi:hypothetical protein